MDSEQNVGATLFRHVKTIGFIRAILDDIQDLREFGQDVVFAADQLEQEVAAYLEYADAPLKVGERETVEA